MIGWAETLPGTDVPAPPAPPRVRGEGDLLFWVVVAVAAAFVIYLLIDGLIIRRRARELREMVRRAAVKRPPEESGP